MTGLGLKAALLGLAAIGEFAASPQARAIEAFDTPDGLMFGGWDIAPAKATKRGGVTKDRSKIKAARRASRISRRKRK